MEVHSMVLELLCAVDTAGLIGAVLLLVMARGVNKKLKVKHMFN
jgi:hypothetical protein